MKKRIYVSWLLVSWLFFLQAPHLVSAQEQAFSLPQAIQYALQNRPSLKTLRNQEQIDKARVGEVRATGLPQVNAGVEINNNFIQQKSIVDFSEFGGASQLNDFTITQQQLRSGQDIVLSPSYSAPDSVPGPQAITFVQPWTGAAALSASQLLFDGSYLIGLRAASTYTQLSKKNTQQGEIEVAEQVSKAYYSVLVAGEQIKLLDQNLRRLDTLLRQTIIMNQNGFVEKLDVDRLRVSYNNLKIDHDKAQRLLALSQQLLKFQMGFPQAQPILLTDQLNENSLATAKPMGNYAGFAYGNRIEYGILETQRDLALLNQRNIKAGYWPRLLLNANYGYNGVGRTFSRLLDVRAGANNTTTRNWFDFGVVGLSLQVPLFDGLRKSYQVQQSRIQLENVKLGFEQLQQAIDLELRQSDVTLENTLSVLRAQRQNLELAEEIARVSRIKYQQGVGSNLEVITAETDLRAAQTSYYSALYDALIAQVDADRATGALLLK
ncbi:TolC family protein [Rufibacter glacialis]|uniref:TolC family protein n=1 Tax=Rufibacter glacialis TaxID=1259555 RepID=A0A5M8Q5L8_9BACT|nr:TolC family protein [Rufibacter glacialis]KAA6430194.1 TolC family protein [Rufibacter glacialis]GGK87186.1 transporter [Rufibacter glacialis]